MQENVKNINIDLLIPFENHPFKKRDGIENEELKESINIVWTTLFIAEKLLSGEEKRKKFKAAVMNIMW